MSVAQETPCRNCRTGLHRMCTHPLVMPTLLSFSSGPRNEESEITSCCDRKEFWAKRLYQ